MSAGVKMPNRVCACGAEYRAWAPFEGGDPGMCPECMGKLAELRRKAERGEGGAPGRVQSDGERPMDGIARIAAERRRQVAVEGWTPEHDDEHCFGEISGAACSYAEAACRQVAEGRKEHRPNQLWRWEREWWKPSDDPVRNLEKAGALVAAEIDRLLRERGS